MVTNVAVIEIKPGMEREFVAGVEQAMPLFLRAKGCHGLSLEQCVEIPEQFFLRVRWESAAHNHNLFVKSDEFKVWRKLVGHCFAGKPRVHNAETVLTSSNDPV
jgi:heme-degrading monooxygenase HmoA